jgi:integrase
MAKPFIPSDATDYHFKIRLAPYRFKTVRLCSDKGISKTWAQLLQNAVDRMNAGEPPKPEKLTGIPQRCLEALGLVSKLAEQRRGTWMANVDDYVGELRTRKLSEKYISNARLYLKLVGEACGWTRLQDAKRGDFVKHLAKRQADEAGPRTLNNITATVKGFLAWALEEQRIDRNPLTKVDKIDDTTDRRRRRRAFTDTEIQALLRAGKARKRDLPYRVALGTGLRLRELRELQWGDVRIDGPGKPHLQLRPEATKSKRADVLPLSADLVARLRKARPQGVRPTDSVFVGPAAPSLFKWEADLARAGIAPKDDEGRLAGFHSLRVTFITDLQRAGLAPRVVMALARHTDWRLTGGTYTDLRILDIFGAAAALPDYPDAKPQRVPKEGTYDGPHTRDQIRDQKGFSDVHSDARHCPASDSSTQEPDDEKTLENRANWAFLGGKSDKTNCGEKNSPGATLFGTTLRFGETHHRILPHAGRRLVGAIEVSPGRDLLRLTPVQNLSIFRGLAA